MNNLERKQSNRFALNNGLDKINNIVIHNRIAVENTLGSQPNTQSISEHIRAVVGQEFAKVKK